MASGVSEANEAQRQQPGVQGQCPGGDSEPDKVIFNVYNYIYCAIIEPRLWNIVPGRKSFFFWWCRAEIVSAGRPRPTPPTVATTLVGGIPNLEILAKTLLAVVCVNVSSVELMYVRIQFQWQQSAN